MKDILWELEDYDSDEREANILLRNAAYEIRQLRSRIETLEQQLEEKKLNEWKL